ncbi:MAG: hypothetical protein ACR2RB_11255 [Gammaproteobacteria bacterium]
MQRAVRRALVSDLEHALALLGRELAFQRQLTLDAVDLAVPCFAALARELSHNHCGFESFGYWYWAGDFCPFNVDSILNLAGQVRRLVCPPAVRVRVYGVFAVSDKFKTTI